MSSNLELARKMVEVYSSNDFARLEPLLAPDAKHFCPGSDFGVELQGRDAIIKYFSDGVISAFHKVNFDIRHIYEDPTQSTVIVEWTSHLWPKSGKNYSNQGVFVIELANGRITCVREYFDTELSAKNVK